MNKIKDLLVIFGCSFLDHISQKLAGIAVHWVKTLHDIVNIIISIISTVVAVIVVVLFCCYKRWTYVLITL